MCTALDDNEFRRGAVGEQLNLLLRVGNSVHDIIGSLDITNTFNVSLCTMYLIYLKVLSNKRA